MNVTGSSSLSLLESVLNAQATRTEISVAVADKAQETIQQQGDAMIKLIEQSAPPVPHLDTYA